MAKEIKNLDASPNAGEVNQTEVQVCVAELASASMDMGSQNETHTDDNAAPAVERDEVAVLDATTGETPGVAPMQQPLMKERVVYTMDEETLQNTLVIASNRKVEKQIKAKQKSCREYGMIVPGVFTNATVAFDAGYELIVPLTGETVKGREETHDKIVIMEGTTRFWALLAEMARIDEHKQNNKWDSDDEKPFEYTFTYRHITNPMVFKNLYRHINIDNVPTSTKDFARDVLATERENMVVISYANKIDCGLSPKAAGFATKGKEVKKKDIKALMAGKVPSIFNNGHGDELETYQMVFEGVCEGFGITKDAPVKNKVLKGSFIWRWIANKMNATDEADRHDVAVKVISIFTSMSAQDSERINNADKTATQTREQVIHSILDEMYNSRNQ
jgi:hypothetical protein